MLWSEKMLDMISIFLSLPRLDFWTKMWSIMENVPCALEKCFLLLSDGMSYKYQLTLSFLMCHFKAWVSLLIFFLDDLSIGVTGVLKSIPILLCYCRFPVLWLLAFALYTEVLHVGFIYIYNCYIFFLGWSLDHYVVSFLVSCNSLYFDIYFVWCEYCYSSFHLVSICME